MRENDFVYVISDEHNRIKIGKSTFDRAQFAGRFSTMQTGNADILTLLCVVTADSELVESKDLERALQYQLNTYHIRGEWYNCCIWDVYDALPRTLDNVEITVWKPNSPVTKNIGFSSFDIAIVCDNKNGLRFRK